MKRLVLVLALVCLLSGCAREELPVEQLTEYGLEVAAALQADCRSKTEQLAPAYESTGKHLLQAAEGDYSAAKAVYQIRVDYEAVRKATGMEAEEAMLLWAVPTMINSRGGTTVLVAAQSVKATLSFAPEHTVAPTLLVLTFETGCPVAVIFTPGEDGSLSVQGVPILNREADFAKSETIEAVLTECCATSTKLK